jgi:hypothetical protein
MTARTATPVATPAQRRPERAAATPEQPLNPEADTEQATVETRQVRSRDAKIYSCWNQYED